MTSAYTELHARSAFSFLRGACVPEDYVGACVAMGLDSVALTDIDGVFGAPRLHRAGKKHSVRAHIGAEVSAQDGSRWTLLAESRKGYQNLCRMITRMKLRSGKKLGGAAQPEEFAEFSDGLICLTGGEEGALARGLKNGTGDETLEAMVRTFGRGNVYVELQRHFEREEEARNQAAIAAARRLQLPLVATNGACYATSAQRQVMDVFTCLHHKTTLREAGRLLSPNSERHLRSAREMAELFSDIPEAIANTQTIASRLRFTLEDLGYQFPEYPLPRGETVESLLWKLTDAGARGRYVPYHDRARTQIEKELALINKLRLGGYFLIVWDIVRFCREKGILCQGRGSAANSAVCYSLGITAVDPVKMELLFERFLTEERGEWPDIDIDLPSGEQREAAIQYVYERYGKLGAAMTANVISYRGKLAAREAGKVLGLDVSTLQQLALANRDIFMYRGGPAHRDAPYHDPPTKDAAAMAAASPKARKFFEVVEALQDLPRHLGQHSGGMVICQGQLDSVVPLEPASMPGRVVVQWDKDDCADMGIVKVDLLGLGMMALLEDCLVLIRDHWRETIDLGRLPADDAKVYQTLETGDTIGMFQVESRAQQATLPRLKPKNFYDLVVEVALIRPGPIVGQMVHPYLARRAGREEVVPLHPLLEPVLARTLGVPLFQEQLLRMAMLAANFTGGEAEELRRAMGFKRSEARMKEIEVKLRAGMTKNGIEGKQQDVIVQSITSFALYGFPESHAASFALLAYASAYFKCHYLAAFTCALLNNQPMGFYSPAVIVKDAQRHGLRVLPVEVNVSEWNCTIEGEEHVLRLGLRYVRGLRAAAGQAVAAAKPFRDVDDLARRVPELNKAELEMLAGIGALVKLETAHRRDALWKAARAGRPTGPLLEEVPECDALAPLLPMTIQERLAADYKGTSMTVGRHPLYHSRAALNELGVTPAGELRSVPNGRLVRVAGCVIVRQRPGTAKGIVFISMEDETGIVNVVVMPDRFEEDRVTIVTSPYLMIEGKMQNVENVVHVLAGRIERLEARLPVGRSHDFR